MSPTLCIASALTRFMFCQYDSARLRNIEETEKAKRKLFETQTTTRINSERVSLCSIFDRLWAPCSNARTLHTNYLHSFLHDHHSSRSQHTCLRIVSGSRTTSRTGARTITTATTATTVAATTIVIITIRIKEDPITGSRTRIVIPAGIKAGAVQAEVWLRTTS